MRLVEDGVHLDVYVQPGAKRNSIVGEHAERLKIAVTQIAEGGKANDAVIDLLAKQWRLSKSQLAIVRGHTNRQKTIAIFGVTQDSMASLLPQTPDS
ncbi:MAG: DUF167 domain-containing protein [Pirellulales bacterium]